MGLFRLRAGAELRSRLRAVVLLTVLVAIGGGTALAALAGARRTDAAVSQFVAYSRPDDGGFLSGSVVTPPVTPGQPPESLAPDPVATRVLALPQVESWSRLPFLYLTVDPGGPSTLTANALVDAPMFRDMDRPLVLAGHLPSPRDPTGAVVNELAARTRHLRVGSTIRLYAYSSSQIRSGALPGGPALGPQVPAGPTFTVRVDAVVRSAQEVDAVRALADRQGVPYEAQQNVYLTGAFLQRYAAGLGIAVAQVPDINLFAVKLHHGAADWPAFAGAAMKTAAGRIFMSAGNVMAVHRAAASAQRSIHLVVVALLAFAGLVALLTVVLVGQALSRQVTLEARDHAVLRALGAGRGQVMAAAVLPAVVVSLAGGALATLAAWLASPIMPLGLARQAEVYPGLSFDAFVLLVGALGLAVLLTACAAVPVWRAGRAPVFALGEAPAETRPGTVGGVLARTSVPPVAEVGVRFGLASGSGRSGAAAALFAAVVAIAAMAASFTFGSSLTNLERSPARQGWNWDVLVGNPSSFSDQEAAYGPILARDRFVAGYSAIAILAGAQQGNAALDGKLVNLLLAFDPLKGAVYPPLVQGHAPRADDEIVLGQKTLAQLHKRIGQSVEAQGPDGQAIRLRIVGTMVAPSVGDLFTNGMGEGGWVYGPALRAQVQQQTQASQSGNAEPPTVFNVFAVRFTPGTSVPAALRTLREQFGPVVLQQIPSQDIVNLQSVDRLPLLIASLVVVLGLATIGNSLVGTVRRRRRDIAVLKTIGFVRRQVAGVVAWQATSFSLAALVVGVPVGVAVGRWAWSLVSSGMGSTAPPYVPILSVGLVVPAAVVAANAMAAAPGWVAARIAPAVAMRSE